ncbi:hypothetical protein NC651_005706 [Populus alba x Populus x berolinensis]|nr:hypothetical protein NC651_005706 [Populus alba x Populus x berolinensis]
MLTILSGIAAAMALVKSQLSTPLPLTDFSSQGPYAKTIRGFDGHGRIDLELPFINKLTAPSPSASMEAIMPWQSSKDKSNPPFTVASYNSSAVTIPSTSTSRASKAVWSKFASSPSSISLVFISKNSCMLSKPSLLVSPCCIIALTSCSLALYPSDPKMPPSSAAVIKPSLSESKALNASIRLRTWFSDSNSAERDPS